MWITAYVALSVIVALILGRMIWVGSGDMDRNSQPAHPAKREIA